MKTVLKIVLGLFCLLIPVGISVATYIGMHDIAPYAVLKPARFEVQKHLQNFPHGIIPQTYGLQADEFDVCVEDTLLLKGWFVFSKHDTARGTILVLHGIGSCKEHMLGTIEMFAREGYNVLAMDMRAHGQSGGEYCTYGYYEREDLKRCIDKVLETYRNVAPIGIYGVSLGGAVALQTMAEDKRIRCGIVESTFATLEEIAYDYMKRLTGIPFKFFSDGALHRAGEVAHFNIEKVKPEESAKAIRQPVFIIHGDMDKNISIEYGKRIYRNLGSTSKAWYAVAGADHNNVGGKGGTEYKRKIVEFMGRQISK